VAENSRENVSKLDHPNFYRISKRIPSHQWNAIVHIFILERKLAPKSEFFDHCAVKN